MNKLQFKIFINAMFEWLLVLLTFIILFILQIFNIDFIIDIVKQSYIESNFDFILMSVVVIIPIVSIFLILYKVIYPCYKDILKENWW